MAVVIIRTDMGTMATLTDTVTLTGIPVMDTATLIDLTVMDLDALMDGITQAIEVVFTAATGVADIFTGDEVKQNYYNEMR
jgi:hypothetical protein